MTIAPTCDTPGSLIPVDSLGPSGSPAPIPDLTSCYWRLHPAGGSCPQTRQTIEVLMPHTSPYHNWRQIYYNWHTLQQITMRETGQNKFLYFSTHSIYMFSTSFLQPNPLTKLPDADVLAFSVYTELVHLPRFFNIASRTPDRPAPIWGCGH